MIFIKNIFIKVNMLETTEIIDEIVQTKIDATSIIIFEMYTYMYI